MLGRNFLLAAALAAGIFAALPARAQQTLEAIKARGQLICGIHTGVAGFAQPDSRGVWQGMDVDMCRALAVAIFNDAGKVRFVPLSSSTRFTALGSGEVDVLFRTSTQTMLRDVTLGLRHVVTYFYDGHGFIVRKGTVEKVAEMRDATICLIQGTTNEQVTADYFRSINTPFRPLLFERTDQAANALQAGRCDSLGTDASQLAGIRSTMQTPQDWVVLPERFSKEPYGAYIRRDDPQWFDVVRWATSALIEAEEQGITQANAEEQRRTSVNPNTRRLLGVTPELGEALKLDRGWAYNMVRALGNYGEIYDRSFGPRTPVDLPRGPNKLWTQGGLIYALPLR
ncbi:amino acid ABC transporter substrate-binding protein [Siccirubricoccus sp. KC 17139]|uniref:Amino acid ABC transporter substrate-binding protein n=1 Tax=Siccirubricoccus soli TaxID=2899147 RepID=A0ABT1D8Y7_9PROT|nr:amino acid ABC transporter substrate-binding protein [Siccirubricoccus soli]MCO6418366.1 amino acid ABC transporter substrate-binding protein [Siccirubricoccus soli]MCP2684501.1 amino acid ABC transporter substrate-binding protein [Siccirubricoccus soli]